MIITGVPRGAVEGGGDSAQTALSKGAALSQGGGKKVKFTVNDVKKVKLTVNN